MSVSSVCTKGGGGLGQSIDIILYHIPEILHKKFFPCEVIADLQCISVIQ